MKSSYWDICEMSDSIEIYDARPKFASIVFIYIILLMFCSAGIWLVISHIDISIKSSGIIRNINEGIDISNQINGTVSETFVKDGEYVSKGDILYRMVNNDIEDTLKKLTIQKEDSEDRISALKKYQNYLYDITGELDIDRSNRYYGEYCQKAEILKNNIQKVTIESDLMSDIKKLESEIEEKKRKINLMNLAETSIKIKKNKIDETEKEYYSLVEKYISEYSYTRLKYETQIGESSNVSSESVNRIKSEMEAALDNLEENYVYSINQSISACNDDIYKIKKEIESLKNRTNLLSFNSDNILINALQDTESEKNIYTQKLSETEELIRQYEDKKDSLNVYANYSGFIYLNRTINIGSYLAAGETVCRIIPKESSIYAEVYVSNSEIGDLKEGQSVKLAVDGWEIQEDEEIIGTIEKISKDIRTDLNSQTAYYIVTVSCKNKYLKSDNGEIKELKNGMKVNAKILIGKKQLIRYVFEILNIL